MHPQLVRSYLVLAAGRALHRHDSPGHELAHALNVLRGLLRDERELRRQFKRDHLLRYEDMVADMDQRIHQLLPLVSSAALARALIKLETASVSRVEKLVLESCWSIYARTRDLPDSGLAVHKEIRNKLEGTKQTCPSPSQVYDVLNRLTIQTKRGKAGPTRGSRHKKTSGKRR
jgi:hypothetical protein